jgi:hypothetical protein
VYINLFVSVTGHNILFPYPICLILYIGERDKEKDREIHICKVILSADVMLAVYLRGTARILRKVCPTHFLLVTPFVAASLGFIKMRVGQTSRSH